MRARIFAIIELTGRLGARGFLSAYASAAPERQSAQLVALWEPLAGALAAGFRRLTGVALGTDD